MSFRWLRVVPALLLVLMGLLGAGSAVAQDATPAAIAGGSGLEGATAWLQSQQAADGGFIGYSGESDPGFTLDALIALGAARNAGIDTTASIDAAVAYLGEGDNALVYAQTGVGQSAKLILGLIAVGVEPEGFANVMPLTIIQSGADENATTGIYGTGIYDHALSILALVAMGEDVPAEAIDALAATQSAVGGWAWDASTEDANSDSNTTSMVVQALLAAGHGDSELVTNAMTFLDSTWTDGGALYSLADGATPDSNSTALVIQAELAVGNDVTGREPALVAFQNPSGALFFNADDTTDSAYSVVQAIPALAGQAFPILGMTPSTPAATPVSWTWSLAA